MNQDLIELMKMVEASREISPERLLLGASQVPQALRREVAQQLYLRPALKRKLPLWYERRAFVPSRLALEQCSSDETARFKTRFVLPADIVGDLTGGLGVDTLALASVASSAYYIEEQAELVKAADYNFPLLSSRPPAIIHGEALSQLPWLLKIGCTLLYVDPARRAGISGSDRNVRRYAIGDCRPDLHFLLNALGQCNGVRILTKLSTMLDLTHTLRQIPSTRSLHLVSAGRELKELLVCIDPSRPPIPLEDIPIEVVDADSSDAKSFVFTLGQEAAAPSLIASTLQDYIYEPLPGLMKSGAFKLFAHRFGLRQLHPNSHLYTSNELVPGLQARTFRLDRIIPFRKQDLHSLSRKLKAAAISVRHFPLTAPILRSRLRLAEADSPTIIGSTIATGEHVLLLTQPIR